MDATLIISDNKMRAMELKPSRFNKSGKRKRSVNPKANCVVYIHPNALNDSMHRTNEKAVISRLMRFVSTTVLRCSTDWEGLVPH